MNRFLANPAAGRGRVRRSLRELRRWAERVGADLLVSEDSSDLTAIARKAVLDGVERLIVAGGDGTFHHVAQGLVGSDCALGLVPLGRGNDLAASLGTPPGMRAAVEFALQGGVRTMDLGVVRGRVFNGYCGVGFDSEAARVAHRAPSLFRGSLTYVYSVLRTLLSFRAPLLQVEFDGGSFEGRAMFAAVCNVPLFGGGMRIAPAARFDDGWLDLVIVEEMTRRQALRVFPRVYRGDHVTHPAVRILRTRTARIAADRPLTVACDGELLFEMRGECLEALTRPQALRVVAPGRQLF